MEILKDLQTSVFGFLEKQNAAYSQVVEAMKQQRLLENPDFPHAPDCPENRGLSIIPHITIWGGVDIDIYTNARCDDCSVVAQINGKLIS